MLLRKVIKPVVNNNVPEPQPVKEQKHTENKEEIKPKKGRVKKPVEKTKED